MDIDISSLIITFINIAITLAIFSFLILAIIKIMKTLRHSKDTNTLILKELKDISSKLDKKD